MPPAKSAPLVDMTDHATFDYTQCTEAFLAGGGALGELMAAHDWSRTPLGPIPEWPQSLRNAVSLILPAPTAMVLLWGPAGYMVYNAAYAAIVGERHPAILGESAEVAFPEFAAFNRHVLEVCLGGGVLSYKDRQMTLLRGSSPEEFWFDLHYSPVADETGRPAGVLAVVIDTTARSLADERLRIAQEAGRFGAFEWFPRQRKLVVSDAYRQIFGLAPEHEVADHAVMALVLPDDRELARASRHDASANPLCYTEYRIRHGVTGATRWIARRGEILESSGALPRYLGVAWDITERKEAELQEAFLAGLSQALQNVGDPVQVIAIATRMLGEYLGVGRVGYGEMNDAGTHLVIAHDWTDGTMAHFTGAYRVDEFGGKNLALVRAGGILRQADMLADPALSAPEIIAAHQRIGVRAALAVPLMRDGQFAGVLFAHCAYVRPWDDRDEAVALAVVARTWDAVQRARAEQRLRESEETFRLFAQAMPIQVWATEPGGRAIWFNELVYSFSGAAPGTLDGEAWLAYVHPDDRPGAAAAWKESVLHGTIYETEFRVRRHDGVYRWHIARALAVRNASGAVTRWIGSCTDIEEQRRMLADLARLNTALEGRVAERTRERDRLWTLSRDPLLIADRAGTWLSVSPAWTQILGWQQAELEGRTADWMAHPDDPKLCLMVPAVDGPPAAVVDRTESRFRARDGTYRWFSWTAVAEGALLYCVARDVTTEKAAAERLRHAEEALRQSQKMEAIGQLTGGIAHDFNNLLTGIQGSLELVRRRLATGRTKDVDVFMDAAMTSSQRAASLTQRLLAFARRQSLDTRAVAIDVLVQDMAELMSRTIGEHINLKFQTAAATWHALTDPNQLENAILNLAINARDAMPHGGTLTIATSNLIAPADGAPADGAPADGAPADGAPADGAPADGAPADGAPADGAPADGVPADGAPADGAPADGVQTDAGQTNLELEAGEYVVISVIDTGTGMSKAVLEKVFEPFFTTKPVGQGTGLGLSMVYGFIHQCGGHVRIESEIGCGTTVKLILPRARAQPIASVPPSSELPTGAGETVLVVEDDPAVRMLVIAVLQELGYRPLEACDATTALPILASAPTIDLLISDVGLPGLNGRQLADFARVRMPDLKVLFVTGYAEQAASRSGFLAPGMAMITKPFAMETLAAKVREMMRQPHTA
jgi:PAS domain S-box-containing protein